jgi:UDP-N-acetyl-D-mannosaminuronate dehydrogenase
MFATHGFQVVGVDIDQRVVETLNNGVFPLRKWNGQPGAEGQRSMGARERYPKSEFSIPNSEIH